MSNIDSKKDSAKVHVAMLAYYPANVVEVYDHLMTVRWKTQEDAAHAGRAAAMLAIRAIEAMEAPQPAANMLSEKLIPRMRASMPTDDSFVTTLPTHVLSALLDYVEELERMASAADLAAGVLMLSAPGEAESLRERIRKSIQEAQKVSSLYGA